MAYLSDPTQTEISPEILDKFIADFWSNFGNDKYISRVWSGKVAPAEDQIRSKDSPMGKDAIHSPIIGQATIIEAWHSMSWSYAQASDPVLTQIKRYLELKGQINLIVDIAGQVDKYIYNYGNRKSIIIRQDVPGSFHAYARWNSAKKQRATNFDFKYSLDTPVKKFISTYTNIASLKTQEEFVKWLNEKDTKFTTAHPLLKVVDEWYSHRLS